MKDQSVATGAGELAGPPPASPAPAATFSRRWLLPLLFLAAAAAGCGEQLKDAFAKHLQADRDSARTTKEATRKMRQPDCDAVCHEQCLKAIDAQADAVAP